MKRLDYPPIWLLAAMMLAYWLDHLAPSLGLDMPLGEWASWLGAGLFFAGLCLTGLAVWEFARVKTTIIPHQMPSALITSGVFAYSRNPIYLADVLMLSGVILYWQVSLALPLVPLFAQLLRKRFIDAEENRLKEAFPDAIEAYFNATRRWI